MLFTDYRYKYNLFSPKSVNSTKSPIEFSKSCNWNNIITPFKVSRAHTKLQVTWLKQFLRCNSVIFFTNYFLNSVVSRGGKSSLQFSHQFESLWIQQKNFGISTNFTKLCCGMAWNLALEDHVSYLVIVALFIHINQSQLMQTCKLLYNIEFTYSLTCTLIFWFF